MSAKICILDPANHIPALKKLFPEADYYAHSPDSFFHFSSTQHYTSQQNFNEHGFHYRTDWDTINDSNYDILFIAATVHCYACGLKEEYTRHIRGMRDRIATIIDTNSFKKVVLFDSHDYDYDPSELNTFWKVDYYFKRNYQRNKVYTPNVFPFPYMMFVKPCVLNMCLSASKHSYTINRAFWCGALYNHVDNITKVYKDRVGMYSQIAGLIDTLPGSDHSTYLNRMRAYKIGVDLVGLGDPNKRTIELLTNGVLMLSMCKELEWGFEDGDAFHPDTFFTTADEFKEKLHRLLTDEDHYKTCLQQQYYLLDKYFNQPWLRKYIQNCIGY